MRRNRPGRLLSSLLLSAAAAVPASLSHSAAWAQESVVVLQNGLTIGPGARAAVSGVDQAAYSGNVLNSEIASKPILVVDDNLRLTFVRSITVQNINDWNQPLTVIETGNADLRATGRRPQVAAVQKAVGVTPFDEFGRRIYALRTPDGPREILQGITELSANYVRVEGLEAENAVIWDMRLALSAVEPQRLREILYRQVDLSVPQNWLDIVSVYLQAQRYREAREVLLEAIDRHPELEHHRPQLQQFEELNAELMFREIGARSAAGQYELARSLLESFDRGGVAIETQVKVDRELKRYADEEKRIADLVTDLRRLLGEVTDPTLQAAAAGVVDEIEQQISPSTLGRFADFAQLEKAEGNRALAAGVSGWLMGAGGAVTSLPMATSLAEARELVREYLASPDAARRQEIVERLRRIEAGTTPYVAALAAQLRPPLELGGSELSPGRYEIELAVAAIPGAPKTRYTVQLPPEYDPNRKYPCVLTLHGEFSAPAEQVAWWAGDYSEQFQRCMGEASRHGYVVVAPHWAGEKQAYYDYTENEHARVLAALRDAMRRVSIDSDRIFLSGHHMGGDAAWDMALAHPDLWAGAIVIGGDCERYAVKYYENAKHVPMYFVVGELDGAPGPLVQNGKYFDRYLDSAQYDCMLVVYKGRGRDHFQEELPRITQWMNLAAHRRDFAPKNFRVSTARGGDRFFWFLELRDILPHLLIHPLHAEQFNKKNATEVEAALLRPAVNGVRVGAVPAKGYSLLLGPEHVSFDDKIVVHDRNSTKQHDPTLDVAFVLEDLRQRADRQHPFWIRIDR